MTRHIRAALMLTFASAAFAAPLAMLTPAVAQDSMKAPDSSMSKDSMSHGDSMGMKKGSMGMKNDGMAHHAMKKDAMQHDAMSSGMSKDSSMSPKPQGN